MNRRDFLIAAGAGTIATAALTAAGQSPQARPSIIKPRRLKAGDTVGVVTPATATFQQVEHDLT